MKIVFSRHAKESMRKRGANEKEVKEVIAKDKWRETKMERFEATRNFPYQKEWNNKVYQTKQVNPVFVKENTTVTVITVYVFYFNE